jgi:hypothetical protein
MVNGGVELKLLIEHEAQPAGNVPMVFSAGKKNGERILALSPVRHPLIGGLVVRLQPCSQTEAERRFPFQNHIFETKVELVGILGLDLIDALKSI